MLLLLTSYTEIIPTLPGKRYRGSFADIDEFALVRKPPIKDLTDDEEEVLLAWHVNMDELEN